jgi:LytS/YehU family sensor histidine kinase
VEIRGREQQILKDRDEAEVLALLALIKPHFIFNTLNAIASLIPEDPPKAEEMTLRLAQLLRSILEVKNGASLGSEITIVQAYLEIEKVRYGERLQYRLEVAKELEAVSMPGLILQPLVENAINHGIRQRADGGYVHLSARAVGANCTVRIIDNGPGFSDHQGAGKAMNLLAERLARLYRDRCSLTLQRDEKAGETVVELSFPRIPLQPL